MSLPAAPPMHAALVFPPYFLAKSKGEIGFRSTVMSVCFARFAGIIGSALFSGAVSIIIKVYL